MVMSRLIVVLFMGVALSVSTTYCGGTVLPLLRAHPPAHKGNLVSHIARDQARQRGVISSYALSGSDNLFIVGLYYTKIQLGTPPQEFVVDIDTGSATLWVNCVSCTGCPHTTDLGITLNYFDPANSSTVSSCRGHNCDYSVNYIDGSVTIGYKLTDLLHLPYTINGTGGIISYPVTFGCSTTRTGLFSATPHAVDGILGLGPRSTSVVSQLSSQAVMPQVFSHCLKGGDVGGGFLVFGEVVDPGVVYTPFIHSQHHYNVRLLSIDVNGQIVPIDSERVVSNGNQGIAIDSGTSLTYLLEKDYHSFVNAINNAVSQVAVLKVFGKLECYVQKTSLPINFPSITLRFDGGANMTLRPQDYILYAEVKDGSIKPCMGFQIIQDNGYPILGDLSLKDKVIIYDLSQQRIGLIDQYDCWGPFNVNASYGFSSAHTYNHINVQNQKNVLVIIFILLQLLIQN